MSNYFPGQNITFFSNFTDVNDFPINSGISNVNIFVYNVSGTNKSFLINGSGMTQDINFLNNWYYNYQIPLNTLLTNYNIIYEANYSGNTIQKSDNFETSNSIYPVPPVFSGSVLSSGNIIDVSGNNVFNVITSVTQGNQYITSTSSDSNGNYYLSLDAGNYYFSYIKDGYYTINQIKIIPTGTTLYNLGQTTFTEIIPPTGLTTITDTLLCYDQNGVNQLPLIGLKITLWNPERINETQPLLTTYTDISGTFTLSALEGNYILKFIGQDQFNNRYNYSKDIEINSMWPPMNFQYQDSSSYNYLT
jgi:hypothetical protein